LEAKAVEKYIKISSLKVKYVIDIIKNKPVEQAVGILSLTPKRAAGFLLKAIQSAAANAVENFKEYKVSEDDLFIKEIFVTEGPTLKRFKPRARGRADRVLKRTSHITVIVSDGKNGAGDEGKVRKEKNPDSVKTDLKQAVKTGKTKTVKSTGQVARKAPVKGGSQVTSKVKKEAKS